jgi:ubiquitin thioesterase protein OTUB1
MRAAPAGFNHHQHTGQHQLGRNQHQHQHQDHPQSLSLAMADPAYMTSDEEMAHLQKLSSEFEPEASVSAMPLEPWLMCCRR